MKNLAICFLLFTGVSFTSLFAMKYILWAMFKWGGLGAILLAMIFTCIYIAGFYTLTKKWNGYKECVSLTGLKWIWILGYIQLAVLGGLYHLLPQYFPAVIADFFFS